MVQYMFDGPEIDIQVKPHGNSKTATPFFTTAKKTREHIQELATKSTPIQAVTSKQGGEINARGAAFLLEIGSKLLISDEPLQNQRTRLCCTASCSSAS